MKQYLLGGVIVAALFAGGLVAAQQSPQALVEETSALIIKKLQDEEALLEAEPRRIYELVDEIVLPHFDFEYMAQMVLAKNWRQASAAERQAFTEEFKMLLVRTYATSLSEYSDQELVILPFRPERDESRATVRSERMVEANSV